MNFSSRCIELIDNYAHDEFCSNISCAEEDPHAIGIAYTTIDGENDDIGELQVYADIVNMSFIYEIYNYETEETCREVETYKSEEDYLEALKYLDFQELYSYCIHMAYLKDWI